MVRGIAKDPAQLRDDAAKWLGNRRLPRRRVEHLPFAPAVVVHRHVEGGRHVLCGTFDDGPFVARSPPHPDAVCACPFDQCLRASRVRQCDSELRTVVAGWAEIR
jgi:hypothetical protein